MIKMGARKRMLLLGIAISCMLAASIVQVQLQVHSQAAAATDVAPHTLVTYPNFRFQSILNGSFYGSNSSTTLFSPFVVSNGSFVHGRYVNFVMGYGSEVLPNSVSVNGPEIFNFHLNQSPISGSSSQLFSSMLFLSTSSSSFTQGVKGPIFYLYSNSMLIIIHDDPQGIMQFYTNNETVFVSVSLSIGLTLSSSLQSGMPVQKSFSTLTYSNANMTGYIMTGGPNMSSNSTAINQISSYYEVQTTLAAYSFLSTFQVPNTVSTFNSALTYLAQGMAKGVVSYLASATMSGGAFSYESSYALPSVSVTSVSAPKDGIRLSVDSSGIAGGTTMVFLFGGGLYNLTGSQAYVYVNGERVTQQSRLTSLILSGPGNSTSYNVSRIGGYTMVAVSSPNQVSAILLSSSSPSSTGISVSNAVSGLIPLVAALSVISIASVALYRRKSA